MSLHLFATPVQCTHCGTVVDDPKLDRCPKCGALLMERRTPGRLAGVERRYGHLRFLLGFLRFLGVMTILVGALVFISSLGNDRSSYAQGLMTLLGTLVGAVTMFSVAAFFELAIDVEENTRAAFRVQQMLLEANGGERGRAVWDAEGRAPVGAAEPAAEAPVTVLEAAPPLATGAG
jgi:predicted  nucleic acid-binding Zn-ribbon protein